VECNLTGKKVSVVQTNFVSKKHQLYTVEKNIKDVISCDDKKRIHKLEDKFTMPHGYNFGC